MKRQKEFTNVRYGINKNFIRPSTKSMLLLLLTVFLLVIEVVKCSSIHEGESSLDDNRNIDGKLNKNSCLQLISVHRRH